MFPWKQEHEQKRHLCKQPDQPHRSTALHHALVTSSASAALPILPTWIAKSCTVALLNMTSASKKYIQDNNKSINKAASLQGKDVWHKMQRRRQKSQQQARPSFIVSSTWRCLQEGLCMHSTSMRWKTSCNDIHETEMQKHLRLYKMYPPIVSNLIVIQCCKSWHTVNISEHNTDFVGFP